MLTPLVTKKAFSTGYGLVGYLVFFGSFLYATGCAGNYLVPNEAPLFKALLTNTLLPLLFARQPVGGAIWAFEKVGVKPVLQTTSPTGGSLVLVSPFSPIISMCAGCGSCGCISMASRFAFPDATSSPITKFRLKRGSNKPGSCTLLTIGHTFFSHVLKPQL